MRIIQSIHHTIGYICALILFLPLSANTQVIEEFEPIDASIITNVMRGLTNATLKLNPGVYDMADQLRFNANTNLILEGSGSGFGPEATILDFSTFSEIGDGRALSIRGGVIVRNLTIMNVSDRATDLRTGTVDSSSDESVVFENVWFINCNVVFKSTGGRIVGSPENPMQVKHCVFAQTPEYPFPSINDIVDIRDTTYINFDHCDFFNYDDILQQTLDDPEVAPNDGAQVIVTNSIFYATDGEVDDEYDFDIQAGTLTLSNNVYWDAGSESDIQRRGDGIIEDEHSKVGDPLYLNADANVPATELDFSLLTGSPAIAAGNDGLDSGSVAAEPVSVIDWMIK